MAAALAFHASVLPRILDCATSESPGLDVHLRFRLRASSWGGYARHSGRSASFPSTGTPAVLESSPAGEVLLRPHIGILANLAIGLGGILFLTWQKRPPHTNVSWALRQVHIALDSLVLYGTLNVSSSRVDATMVSSNNASNRRAHGDRSDNARQSSARLHSTPGNQNLKHHSLRSQLAASTSSELIAV